MGAAVAVRASGRIVLSTVPAITICDIQIRENASQNIGVSVMACCTQKIDACIAQGAGKLFTFTDQMSVDYSTATEITFDIWTRKPGVGGGTSVASYSLTGGDITLATDYQFQLTITASESEVFPAGRLWCEAWVTPSDADHRRLVGAGAFDVQDTRKHD